MDSVGRWWAERLDSGARQISVLPNRSAKLLFKQARLHGGGRANDVGGNQTILQHLAGISARQRTLALTAPFLRARAVT